MKRIILLFFALLLGSCQPVAARQHVEPTPVVAVRPTDIPWTDRPLEILPGETLTLNSKTGLTVTIHVFTVPEDANCPTHLNMGIKDHPEFVMPPRCPVTGKQISMDEINGFSDNRFGMELQVLHDRVAVFFNTDLWIAPP